jgi:hypothetical protein
LEKLGKRDFTVYVPAYLLQCLLGRLETFESDIRKGEAGGVLTAATFGRRNGIIRRADASLARLDHIGTHEFAQYLRGWPVFFQGGNCEFYAQFRLDSERHLNFFGHFVFLFQNGIKIGI